MQGELFSGSAKYHLIADLLGAFIAKTYQLY